MNTNSWTLTFMVFLVAVGVAGSPDKFNADKNVCVPVSRTWYTNVGTPVLGPDGKPIECTPPVIK